jgi:molecular chaperone DnaK (HSP70)
MQSGSVMLTGASNANTLKLKRDESLILLDIIGMHLGIEIAGGKMEIILKKGTNIPFSSSKIFTTNEDNQESISFNVYQGDYENDISKNYLLNEFCIDNIKKGKAGEEVFEVTFTIDPNSCLIVSAKNIKTGEKILVKKIDKFSRLNERRLKEINKREEKRKIQREKYKLNLELRNKLIELFIKEKKKGNKIAFELFENLKDDKRNINEVLYNKYYKILYSES